MQSAGQARLSSLPEAASKSRGFAAQRASKPEMAVTTWEVARYMIGMRIWEFPLSVIEFKWMRSDEMLMRGDGVRLRLECPSNLYIWAPEQNHSMDPLLGINEPFAGENFPQHKIVRFIL